METATPKENHRCFSSAAKSAESPKEKPEASPTKADVRGDESPPAVEEDVIDGITPSVSHRIPRLSPVQERKLGPRALGPSRVPLDFPNLEALCINGLPQGERGDEETSPTCPFPCVSII